ncbi:MAG TPA: hypothetical protein VF456_14240 [Vicinamibacterales bacterium]
MAKRIIWTIAVAALATTASKAVLACGDKFLMVGRGLNFQRAYAAVHPASIVIVLPPKSMKSAAVRDSRLQSALKMAGHKVEVVKQPTDLRDALARSRQDIVLVERADAEAISGMIATSPKPSVVAVMEDPSPAEVAAAREQLDYVLKTPLPVNQVLNLLDDVMKARIEASRHPAGS